MIYKLPLVLGILLLFLSGCSKFIILEETANLSNLTGLNISGTLNLSSASSSTFIYSGDDLSEVKTYFPNNLNVSTQIIRSGDTIIAVIYNKSQGNTSTISIFNLSYDGDNLESITYN